MLRTHDYELSSGLPNSFSTHVHAYTIMSLVGDRTPEVVRWWYRHGRRPYQRPPSLVAASVGIALLSGDSVTIEAADIVLMCSDLFDVVAALHPSRAIFATIRLNLVWACLYNVLGIPLAMGFFLLLNVSLPPMGAAVAIAFSSVSVVTSELALKGGCARGRA